MSDYQQSTTADLNAMCGIGSGKTRFCVEKREARNRIQKRFQMSEPKEVHGVDHLDWTDWLSLMPTAKGPWLFTLFVGRKTPCEGDTTKSRHVCLCAEAKISQVREVNGKTE